jgi:hypothetical protein
MLCKYVDARSAYMYSSEMEILRNLSFLTSFCIAVISRPYWPILCILFIPFFVVLLRATGLHGHGISCAGVKSGRSETIG